MANELRLSRKLAATPDEVFDAWTDPASVMQWMNGMPGGTTRAQLDVRVGGRFQIDMMNGSETYPHEGEYLRLERPRLLEFSWISDGTQRQRSIVTVELAPYGDDETELTLTHKLLPSAEATRQHREGWSLILDQLAGTFSRAAH